MQFLFFTRLFLWLLAFALPVIHPSIVVPYDRSGWWLWFFLVPGEMLVSFYLSPPRHRVRTWIGAGAGLLVLSIIIFSGFSSSSLVYAGVGTAVWVLTALIFKTGGRGYPAVVLEQFFLGFLYFKLIGFSRASESVARESGGITQAVFVIFIVVFLLHGVVLYLAAYRVGRTGRKGRLREFALSLGAPLFVAVLLVLILPGDFVSHSVVFNFLKPEPKPDPLRVDGRGEGLDSGNLRSPNMPGGDLGDGELDGDLSGQGQGMLEGIDADQWPSQGEGQGGGSDDRQYAVMVVASPQEPVYASEAYYGRFDPERGFLYTPDNPLNDLVHIRLLETWENREPVTDLKRFPLDVFFLSMFPDRMFAYRPHRLEPTVFNRRFHPFNYSHRAVSLVSRAGINDWQLIRGLNADERRELQTYLEIPLPEPVSRAFVSYLEGALEGKTGYFEKVLALFESFSSFHYELGFEDNVSVARMEEFLTNDRRGDCTDFSNSAAILTRMAGIPSRVVTGYVASRQLQQPAHRRGLRVLRETIEPLQAYPLNQLYLVTTAHRHSWIQLYMPGYGWVDFDPTSFAIPPPGGGLLANMRVVIPIITIEELPAFAEFPWQVLLRGALMLAVVLLVGIYLYRYGMIAHLRIRSRGSDPESLHALLTLLLMKLSFNGYALKSPSQTPLEYARTYPELQRFASLYTELRYRERFAEGERAQLRREMLEDYASIVHTARRRGFVGTLQRGFSLRGLSYR